MKHSAAIVTVITLLLALPFGERASLAFAAALPSDRGCTCEVSDREPTVKKSVNPAYPEEAKAKGIEGKVYVSILVDTAGKVKEAKIVKSENEVFNTAALEAAKQWIFSPALKDGKPVEAWVTMPFMFKLADKK